MIHYWECRRCTHQWQSCCFGHIGLTPEEQERRSRQTSSWICMDCFEQMEAGEITGLEIFDLLYYLSNKSVRYAGRYDGAYIRQSKYGGMCHEYRSKVYGEDGNTIIDEGHFEAGFTAEQSQLHNIVGDIREIYLDVIKAQRTEKRVELDEFQKTAGVVFFGPQPRPEGFEGDPPGKPRATVLFGLDLRSGDILAPHVIMEDGNG